MLRSRVSLVATVFIGICVLSVVFYRYVIYLPEQRRDAESILGMSIPEDGRNLKFEIYHWPAGVSMLLRIDLHSDDVERFLNNICEDSVELKSDENIMADSLDSKDWGLPPTSPFASVRCTPNDKLVKILVEYKEQDTTRIFVSVTAG